MKAIQIDSYGKPEKLKLVDLPIPAIEPTELLVQNIVASINPYDCMVRSGSMWFMEGFRFPKILGCESAGVVVKVGSDIKNFSVGQRVIAFTGRKNAYAEFIALPEMNVAPLPDTISYNEGAAIPVAGCTTYDALHLLADVKRDQRVLIYGAYGSVGSFAVQLAKNAGAYVVGVCSSSNLASVKAIGADEVIDYTSTDFRTLAMKFDIILDTPSVLKFNEVKSSMSELSTYIATLPTPVRMFEQLMTSKKGKKAKVVFANPTIEKINSVTKLITEGKVKVILDREYPIEEIAEAHRHSETKRAKGKLIVRF